MLREEKRIQGAENLKWGHEAEQIACDWYLANGYAIREKNWVCGKNEIDLILEKDRVIIFVEVKARKGDNQAPIDAVNAQKRRKMVRGADIYLAMQEHLYSYRFDIFTVTGTRESYEIDHFPDAFLPKVNVR